MTRIIAFFVLLLATLVASSPSRSDTTYSCTAVDRKASVGVKSGTVTVTTGDRTCAFSVGGASVDAREPNEYSYYSPPDDNRDLLARSFNQLLARQFRFDSYDDGQKEALFGLITGPFAGSSDFQQQQNLRNQLDSGFNAYELDRCVMTALSFSEAGELYRGNGVLCGVVAGGDNPATAPFASHLTIVGDERLLVLGLGDGYRSNILTFIPVWMISNGQEMYVR